MLVVRNRPKGARFAFFGLGLCIFALTPTEVGYQDIASLLARQPGVAERWQKRVFSAVRPIQPQTYRLAPPPPPETAAPSDTAPADHAPGLEDPTTSNASVRGAKTSEAAPAGDPAPL